ncbi:MAG: YcaO-like family protein [Chlamydiota bacterium]
MEPIHFRGKSYSAKKRYFAGTHRIQSPEETWEKIAPLAPYIGLTRVANITGLDRMGIPVTLAIRPRSKTLATSSGKGLSLVIAQVSGFMEALELYCAEEIILPFRTLSYHQLIQESATIPVDQLPFRKNSLFNPAWPEKWTMGWDLLQQREVAAPLLAVELNYCTESAHRHSWKEHLSFEESSNGLASGNHFLEALTSAIYEIIERDAIACHQFAADTLPYSIPRIRLETIPYKSVSQLIGQMETMGFHSFLYDCTVDTKVPVFMASIYDKVIYKIGLGTGYGAHLDPEVAMLRALTEAIQGRLVTIAGSRDDMFSIHLPCDQFDTQSLLKSLESVLATVDVSAVHSESTATLEGDTHILIDKLKKVGIDQILVFDLSHPEFDLSVVRVLIPGLQTHYSFFSHVGERARKFADQKRSEVDQTQTSGPIFVKGIHLPAGGAV